MTADAIDVEQVAQMVRRAAVEPPCLDCEIVPDPALGCECDRAGTLEDRLARAMDGWSITFKPTAKAPEVAAPIDVANAELRELRQRIDELHATAQAGRRG